MRRTICAPREACLLLFLCLPAAGQMRVGVHPASAKPVLAGAGARADAGADDDAEPSVIFELGAATNWDTTGGAATFAPNLAAEVTPIEDRLEIEAGASPYFTRDATEWDTDLLFKKPWTLSKKAEFMLGVGPEWAHVRRNGKTTNSGAAEIALDFMFWPSGRHRFGWFFEPSYDYSFQTGHQQSIGMSAGLLIGVRRKRR